jgi:hypothetical protein
LSETARHVGTPICLPCCNSPEKFGNEVGKWKLCVRVVWLTVWCPFTLSNQTPKQSRMWVNPIVGCMSELLRVLKWRTGASCLRGDSVNQVCVLQNGRSFSQSNAPCDQWCVHSLCDRSLVGARYMMASNVRFIML